MAMMMMERPKAKPRNRKSKNKTVSIPEVNDDFSSFESQAQPLEDILTLDFHVDLPGSPGHCFASKVNEDHEDHEDEDHEDKDYEDEDCQCDNDQPKPRRN